MSTHRLAWTELLRLTSAPILRLAVVAMVLIPSIYAGLSLYANRDPHAALPNVPAAIVIEDLGTTLASGENLQVGDDVARQLVESRSFDWHRVDRTAAEEGVRAERFEFAIVVPSAFSADLASVASAQPRQAHLEQITDDAGGFVSRSIAAQVVADVSRSVASRLSVTAAGQVMEGYSDAHVRVQRAADGAGTLADGSERLSAGQGEIASGGAALADGLGSAASGAQQAATGAQELRVGLAQLDRATVDLPAQTRALAQGSREVAAGGAELAQSARDLTAASAQLDASQGTALADLAAQLDAIERSNAASTTPDPRVGASTAALRSELATAGTRLDAARAQIAAASERTTTLATAANQVAQGAGRLSDQGAALRSGIVSAGANSGRLADGTAALAAGLAPLPASAQKLSEGQTAARNASIDLSGHARELATGLAEGLTAMPAATESQRRAVAQVMGDPVAVTQATPAQAEAGESLAPFFLAVSLWIGAFGLFLLVRPLSTRAIAANHPAWRVAVSGWMAPAALAAGQALVAFVLVERIMGLTVERPALVLAFMIATSGVYVAIVLGLVARFGVVGKFLGVLFMVAQLVSAGATYPWQTLPVPLQVVHHVAPMSYVVDGIQQLMSGGALDRMPMILGVLAAYFVVAMLLTGRAVSLQRVWTRARIQPELLL